MSAPTPRFRPILDQFAPYKPGKPPSGRTGPGYKLSSNESPYGPLPSVLKVIAEAAGDANRYPDNTAAELTRMFPPFCPSVVEDASRNCSAATRRISVS